MKNLFTIFIAIGTLFQISSGQIFRQVQPTPITINNPWKGLLFDETSYTSCYNDQINLASYYDPNEPNTKRMNEVLQVSIFTDATFGGYPYANNCTFTSGPYYCQDLKTLSDIFCSSFPEFQANTVLYISFLYTTYVSCVNTITLAPPWENILIIKRTFYPTPQYGSLYFGNPSVTSKTIEYNTDPGPIDNIPASRGDGNFSYQWMTLPYANSTTTLNIAGATYQDFSPGPLTKSTVYQRKDIPEVCGVPNNTNTVSITVLQDVNPGNIGTSQIICYGSSVTITNLQGASGGTGTYDYKWQSSADGTNFQDIPNATSLEYTTPNLTKLTYYQRKCTSGVNSALTNIVVISVRDSLSPGIFASPQPICFGTTPLQIVGTDATGGDGTYTYSWEYSTNAISWTLIPGIITKSYQPDPLTVSTYFHRKVVSGSNCGVKFSSPILVSVYNKIDPGSISKSQSICFGGVPSAITGTAASGGDGNYAYGWWISSNGKNWNQIPGATNLSYQPDALTSSSYFKRMVTISCGTFQSDSVLIEVKNNIAPGTIGNPQTICYNKTPLTLHGNNANGGFNTFTYQWQNSIDNVNWNNINGALGDSLKPSPLSNTLYFRRMASDLYCGSSYSNSVLINVYNQVPKPGVSHKSFYCYRENVTLNAGSGSPYTFYWTDNAGNPLFTGSSYLIPKITQSQLISVKAKDSNGCFSDTLSIPLNVDRVIADFAPNTDTIKTGESVNFINNSTNALTYLWDFSEGEQSTAKNPWHYFNVAGKKTIRLISYSANQCSDTLTRKNLITVNSPNGIGSIANESLKVFPNPMTDKIWIQYVDNKKIIVQIYTVNGVLVHQTEGWHEIVLDVNGYPSGIYFLNITIDHQTKVYKVIKI